MIFCFVSWHKAGFFNLLFYAVIDFDSVTGCEVGIKEFGELPFGACEDPVR